MAPNAIRSRHATLKVVVTALGSLFPLLAEVSCGGGGGSASTTVPMPTLQSIVVSPVASSVELGTTRQFGATGNFSDGTTKDLTQSVAWNSASLEIASVDNAGLLTSKGVGSTTVQASSGAVTASAVVSVTAPGHQLVKDAGLFVQFDRRGYPNGYYTGDVIQSWNQIDPLLATTVASEVSLQLDAIKAMGINTITLQLRTSDPAWTGNFTPPDCNEPPVLGLQFPQPTATELANLPLLLNLAQGKGMKVQLSLINTHMEQQPRTNLQTWYSAIFNAVGSHPALDLLLFDGTPYTSNPTTCGIPAESPLWLGPGSVAAQHFQWVLGLAMSMGIPAQKLSAEAIVGSYFLESQPAAGADATSGHLWSPIAVEKSIFDSLNIPAAQRTYALSLYEHRKCSDAQGLACADLGPHDWADQTLQYVRSVVGSAPRVVASEMGALPPVDQANWNTPRALESLVFLLNKYSIDGGSFWRWASFQDSEDADPTLASPVKPRGLAFTYNPVQKEILDMTGFHLPLVPNGSFELAGTSNAVPASWSVIGSGTATQYLLTQELGQPEVPSRGTHAMRIATGSAAGDRLTATSAMIPVRASTTFTTTSNLRFSWTGDSNPAAAPASRPQVFVTVAYFQQSTTPSALRVSDTVAFFQEDSTSGFATFPVQYTTPADTAFVTISFGANRNGLPVPITLDVDNVR